MEKIIELKPLCEIGRGTAKITPNSVKIDVFGIIPYTIYTGLHRFGSFPIRWYC